MSDAADFGSTARRETADRNLFAVDGPSLKSDEVKWGFPGDEDDFRAIPSFYSGCVILSPR